MDTVLIQGKMIRYVHIPDEVDAISNLQQHVSNPTFPPLTQPHSDGCGPSNLDRYWALWLVAVPVVGT